MSENNTVNCTDCQALIYKFISGNRCPLCWKKLALRLQTENQQLRNQLAAVQNNNHTLFTSKRVFVCSPYSGDIQHNVMIAKRLCLKALKQGHIPFAPHLHYPQFLNDNIPADREAGIHCGLSILVVCDEMWVYTENNNPEPSRGMLREIDHAHKLGVPVIKILDLEN